MAMFKSLTEKHRTINHMIIFNDSISKFYQCSIWGFCWGISMFFSTYLGKKNAELIKFLGILKKYVSENKYIFVKERKAMFRLLKNLFLSFTQFSNLISLCYCYLKVRSLFSACTFKNMMSNYAWTLIIWWKRKIFIDVKDCKFKSCCI